MDTSLKPPVTPTSPIKKAVSIPAIVFTLSVLGHGLFLLVPMPETPESPATLPATPSEAENLSVVVLPKDEAATEPTAPPPSAANLPQTPAKTPSPASQPAPRQAEALLQTNVNAVPAPAPVSPQPRPSSEVTPTPPAAPATPASPTPPPEETVPPEAEVVPQYGDPISPEPVGPLVSYSEAFPHFEGAVGGCFGFVECRRVSGAGSYRNVARSLIDSLEAQGYDIDLRDDLEDTGRNVYEVMPPDQGDVQYLLVFSDMDGSAIYVMSDEIMTLNDLRALQAQQAPGHPSS